MSQHKQTKARKCCVKGGCKQTIVTDAKGIKTHKCKAE
jgi:hypothetical protein